MYTYWTNATFHGISFRTLPFNLVGLPNLDYLLTPRYKATQLCVDRLSEAADAIYDVTAAYSDTVDKTTGERISAPGLAGNKFNFFIPTPGNNKHITDHLPCVNVAEFLPQLLPFYWLFSTCHPYTIVLVQSHHSY